MEMSLAALGVGGIVIVIVLLFLFLGIFASRWQTVGPNEALIISGRKSKGGDFAVIRGSTTFVLPILQKAERISLETLTVEIATPQVYTQQGVPLMIDAVAQIKIEGTEEAIRTASEQFLSKGPNGIRDVAHQTLEGHLRAIVGEMNVEQINSARDAFAGKVQDVSATDLAKMGLTVISFTIKDIRDNKGYLEAMGATRIAQQKKDAAIGEAEAKRDADIKKAEAQRDATIVAARAMQEGQTASLAAQTRTAEADRDYKIKLAEYTATVNQRKAEADLAYDLQRYKTEQLVKSEEVQVQIVQKQREVELQENEIQRREKELTATIQKPAEAEQSKIQTLANAEQYKLKTTALGQAEAIKLEGFAEADIAKAKGIAEAEAKKAQGLAAAEVIKAQGYAEAEAMEKKATAWKSYTEAAIVQMFIDKMPEIARAVAEPLSKTEKIVVISQGGDGAGASKITKDVTNIIAQMPPVLESLTGINVTDLMKTLPGIEERK